jgi:CheY-like chemotaxis protein
MPGLAKPATPPAPRPRSRARGFLRILLVDDEDMLRRCVARALSDFEVISVNSGAEALATLAHDSDFDAVLSDVMMPRMSGPELFAHCQRDYPRLAQRFVFTSGNPESARSELSRVVDELGAPPPILLSKPTTREGLLLALFAAAAHAEPVSGTFSIAEGVPVEVIKHRG